MQWMKRLAAGTGRAPVVRFCLAAHWLQARTLLRRTEEYDRLWDELERDVKHRGLAERTIFALAGAASAAA